MTILYWAQHLLIFFVIIKAVCELRKNFLWADIGKPVYDSYIHSNQHMVYLLLVIIAQIFQGYTYYTTVGHNIVAFDHSVLILLKLTLINGIFLAMIDHFKQERLGVSKTLKLLDLFKF